MVGVPRNLFPVNGGPGSMLATKFGNEELGGRYGKGCCRLAAAFAPPVSVAVNANGGVRASKKTITPETAPVVAYPNSPPRKKCVVGKRLATKPTPRFPMHL